METENEKIFYQNGDVLVTQSRFTANGRTFAMRNISTVALYAKPFSRVGEILLSIISFCCLLSDGARSVGIFLALIVVLMVMFRKPTYTVRISSNSGETDGFESKDHDMISEVVYAVNNAIVYRG